MKITPAAQTGPVLRTRQRPVMMAGLAGFIALIGIFGFWAITTVISGAVITQGQAVVRGKPQELQHLDGGIVAEITVQDGDIVQAGDVLIRLDAALLQMNLDVAKRRLADALTLKARLQAEQQGLAAPVFAYPDLPFTLPDTSAEEAGQRQIFAARRAVQEGSRDQLAETLLQFDNQISGMRAQIEAAREQLVYLDADIDNMRSLTDRNLARASQLNGLQGGRAEMAGRMAALEADIARASNARRDAELQTLQGERAFHEDVVTALREASRQADELILDIITRTAQLDRIEIRAPMDGVVHELQITTLGGVVEPGEVIVQIIPQDQGLDFEMRVDPRDIDQVYVGQPAEALIASFDANAVPKLNGSVAQISPNAIEDPQSGQSFYRINLTVPASELALLGDLAVVPGMPVEGYLATGDRSVMSYLLSPITKQFRRAFREG